VPAGISLSLTKTAQHSLALTHAKVARRRACWLWRRLAHERTTTLPSLHTRSSQSPHTKGPGAEEGLLAGISAGASSSLAALLPLLPLELRGFFLPTGGHGPATSDESTYPKPSTLTLTPQPSTLNPQPSTLTLNPQPSTLNPQPSLSTLNPQPSTLNPQPSLSTLNPQPSTLNPSATSDEPILRERLRNTSGEGEALVEKVKH